VVLTRKRMLSNIATRRAAWPSSCVARATATGLTLIPAEGGEQLSPGCSQQRSPPAALHHETAPAGAAIPHGARIGSCHAPVILTAIVPRPCGKVEPQSRAPKPYFQRFASQHLEVPRMETLPGHWHRTGRWPSSGNPLLHQRLPQGQKALQAAPRVGTGI
jgi:hypothetical protein